MPTVSPPPPASTLPLPRWARAWAIATAALFGISLIFPVAAALSQDTRSFPAWWGVADVALAFVLAGMVIVLMAAVQGKLTRQTEETTYRAYRMLIHVILALLVIFFVAGDRIEWANGLTGLAWRAWLLLYALPSWFAAMARTSGMRI